MQQPLQRKKEKGQPQKRFMRPAPKQIDPSNRIALQLRARHRERHEFAADGIKSKAESFPRVGSQERAVICFSEDDYGHVLPVLIPEPCSSGLAVDDLAVREPESVSSERTDSQLLKH